VVRKQLFRRASDLSDSADPIGIVPFIVKKFGVVLYHLPWAFFDFEEYALIGYLLRLFLSAEISVKQEGTGS
jgi:hypothetical protein